MWYDRGRGRWCVRVEVGFPFSVSTVCCFVLLLLCVTTVCVCVVWNGRRFFIIIFFEKKNSFRFFKGRNSTTGWANISLNRTEPRRTWYFPLRLLSYDWIPKGLRQIEMIRKKRKWPTSPKSSFLWFTSTRCCYWPSRTRLPSLIVAVCAMEAVAMENGPQPTALLPIGDDLMRTTNGINGKSSSNVFRKGVGCPLMARCKCFTWTVDTIAAALSCLASFFLRLLNCFLLESMRLW